MTRERGSNGVRTKQAGNGLAPKHGIDVEGPARRALCAPYKNFLFENHPFCPSLQGKAMGSEGLRRVPNQVDLGVKTWYSHVLWQPQGSGSTKTPSNRSSAITGGPSSRAIRGTRIRSEARSV